jgi:ATP-dependent Clp protease ATP-binding subunit ClpC
MYGDGDEQLFLEPLAPLANLSAQAAAGGLAPAFGRQHVVDDVFQALLGAEPVVLYGPSGVGKSAIWREVARRAQAGAAPPELQRLELFVGSVAALQQGAAYVGWWETKLGELVAALDDRAHAGHRPVLLLSDFGTLFRTQRSGREEGKILADDLVGYLDSRRLRLAGELSPETAQPGFLDYARWTSRVRLVAVEAPAGADLERLLRQTVAHALGRAAPSGWRSGRPASGAAEAAIARAVELSARYLPRLVQPAAALRLLARAQERGGLSEAAVEHAVVAETGVPAALVSDATPLTSAEVVAALGAQVLGQPRAVQAAADAVVLAKAGLNDPARPLATQLYIGPSGTGKTLLAKALAGYLFGDERALVRLDMSEFFGPDSAARLASALVRSMDERLLAVVLLDEIEKADVAAHDVLLQVLSEGRVTDARGRSANLRRALIVLTSNVGFGDVARDVPRAPIGFGQPGQARPVSNGEVEATVPPALRERFRPEFLGRIDQVVPFGQLDRAAVRGVVRRELDRALARSGLQRRGLLVEYDDALVDWLADVGYDARFGLRPLVEQTKQRVVLPVARWLAERPSIRSHLVWLSGADGRLTIRSESV